MSIVYNNVKFNIYILIFYFRKKHLVVHAQKTEESCILKKILEETY